MREAVGEAIRDQVPFEEFQARLVPTLQAKGWWGKRKLMDPLDGSVVNAQLGSPRRLRTIYWANVHTAHAAGEWERSQRNKEFLPFLLYKLSAAERRRPEHEGWVGIVLPVDHPFWDTHYPPNGWGCKCRVRQISRREALSLGWQDGQDDPLVVYEPWHNKRTNQTVSVPKGIDPGWDTNPGKLRGQNVSEFLHKQVASMPPRLQKIAVEDIVTSPILKAMAEGHMKRAFLPVAQLPEKIVTAYGASTNLVRLSGESLEHILHHDPTRALTVGDLRAAIGVIGTGTAMIGRKNAAVIIGSALGSWWRIVVKPAAEGQEWWAVSFHRKSERAAKVILAREKKKGNLLD